MAQKKLVNGRPCRASALLKRKRAGGKSHMLKSALVDTWIPQLSLKDLMLVTNARMWFQCKRRKIALYTTRIGKTMIWRWWWFISPSLPPPSDLCIAYILNFLSKVLTQPYMPTYRFLAVMSESSYNFSRPWWFSDWSIYYNFIHSIFGHYCCCFTRSGMSS